MKFSRPKSGKSLYVALVIAIGVHFLSMSDVFVSGIYAKYLFPVLSGFLRFLSGWIPFSVGDVLYGVILVYVIVGIIRFFSNYLHSNAKKEFMIYVCRVLCFRMTLLYIFFTILWGFHYNRNAIQTDFQLSDQLYDSSELIAINAQLVERVNAYQMSFGAGKKGKLLPNQFFQRSISAYEEIQLKNSLLTYKNPSIKVSMWGWLGNYIGFTGYYNPFTGEAQVNTTVPIFLQPFVCCHEIAHQIGYAREDQANFIAYLVAKKSSDSCLKYSAYFDLFLYANRALYECDSTLAKQFRHQLSPAVRGDIEELKCFNKAHQNKIEPYVSKIYDLFLKTNQQPQGVITYSKVVGWLVAYYKKNGAI